VRTLAGCGKAGNADGVGSAACLRSPTGLLRLPDESLLVSDTGNARLRKIYPDGRVETVAGSGKPGRADADDPLAAQLTDPRGLALAADGSVLIADSGTSMLRRLDETGLHTLAESYHPTGLALAPDASVYVISTRGAMIQRFDGSDKSVVVGRDSQFGDADGAADEARLRPADGIALDCERVVFTDSANHKLRVWDPASGQVQTLAGDGSARSLQMPRGVIVDERGYLVADTGNHRIVRVPRP
jgi:sugar lactone lactonase YvrE